MVNLNFLNSTNYQENKMKKIALAFMGCLACSTFAQAATSPLVESLLEYEAITNAIGAPDFDVINPAEFITEIERITEKVYVLGKVKYEIETKDPSHHNRSKYYIAKLDVAPNPGIGPNIVTVLCIKPLRHDED
jgi:hypothetical protein